LYPFYTKELWGNAIGAITTIETSTTMSFSGLMTAKQFVGDMTGKQEWLMGTLKHSMKLFLDYDLL